MVPAIRAAPSGHEGPGAEMDGILEYSGALALATVARGPSPGALAGPGTAAASGGPGVVAAAAAASNEPGSGRGCCSPPRLASMRALAGPIAALVAIQLTFSGSHLLGAIALESKGVHPLVFALLREALAATAMFALACAVDGPPRAVLRRAVAGLSPRERYADLGWFTLLGALAFCNVVGFIYGLALVGAFRASLLQPSAPVFACLLAAAFGVERISLVKAAGIAAALSGAVALTASAAQASGAASASPSHQSLPHGQLLGTLILVFQCLAIAGWAVAHKRIASRYPVCTTTAWYYSIAFGLTAIAYAGMAVSGGAADGPGGSVLDLRAWAGPDARSIWGALAYATVAATVLVYLALTYANQRVAASTSMAFYALQPLTTGILAAAVLGTHIGGKEVGLGVLIVIGLLLTSYGQHREARGEGLACAGCGCWSGPPRGLSPQAGAGGPLLPLADVAASLAPGKGGGAARGAVLDRDEPALHTLPAAAPDRDGIDARAQA